MKIKRSFLLLAVLSLILILIVLPLSIACAKPVPTPAPTPGPNPAPTPTPSKPIKLEMVAFLPTFLPALTTVNWFIERVNERSKGELIIELVGGPEVIAGVNQPEAVSSGTIDMIWVPFGNYPSYVPEAWGITLSECEPWEERENGFYDYMVDLHKEKMNAYYLGRLADDTPFYLFLNKPVSKPQELSGFKIATTGDMNKPFISALGAAATFVANPELYSAIERGVTDGYVLVPNAAAEASMFEVTKYIVDNPFYRGDVPILINLDKWNQLPEHLQKLMIEVMIEVEKDDEVYFKGETEKGLKKFYDTTEVIKFSPEDAKWYEDLAYSSLWKEWKRKISPEAYSKIRAFIAKKH